MPSISQRLPESFKMASDGEALYLRVSMATTQDVDAVVNVLLAVRSLLSSHRAAVAADFGLPEPPEPPMIKQIMELIG